MFTSLTLVFAFTLSLILPLFLLFLSRTPPPSQARFGSARALPRRYTKYFGRSGTATPQLAAHALQQWRRWERGIEAWQRPVLEEANLTPVYKCLLFNELYFLVSALKHTHTIRSPRCCFSNLRTFSSFNFFIVYKDASCSFLFFPLPYPSSLL